MGEESKRRESEKSTNKKERNRNGRNKRGKKDLGKGMWQPDVSRELERTSRHGRRFSCRVWPPSSQSIQGKVPKGIIAVKGDPERVNGPGRGSTTTRETDRKKVQFHLPGGLRSLQ